MPPTDSSYRHSHRHRRRLDDDDNDMKKKSDTFFGQDVKIIRRVKRYVYV